MSAGPSIGHIGVLTSGGDSPGMNAAIRAVVRAATSRGLRVSGILNGYEGLLQDRLIPLGPRDVSNIVQRGGTMLRSARSEEFRTAAGRVKAKETLERHGIGALVAIGGDGTFTGAHLLHQEHGVRIVGLPGTIDNDLAGTDRTIGFDTAVNTAIEAIDKIRDTASAHERLFFVEVMGRDTGFIALASAIGSGAEYVMLPEVPQRIEELVAALRQAKTSKSSSIVVVAEGDEMGNAFAIAGQVKEHLPHFDMRVTVLGHLQRGGSPSAMDRVLASRLGVAAVDRILEGAHDAMLGEVCGRVVLTPFAEAIGNRKQLDEQLLAILPVLAT
ncbi:MAG: 6-phosphofructokinase [Flavobacteriales bacterium]|nr:6-phosphofructokinase [Flavobacteriales bacterium]